MSAQAPIIKYQSEQIPNDATLFLRVHKNQPIENMAGKVHPRVFMPPHYDEDNSKLYNLSADWDKYSTAQKTKDYVKNLLKNDKKTLRNPEDYYIISVSVEYVRSIGFKVEHVPCHDINSINNSYNRAHCEIHEIEGVLFTGKNRELLAEKSKRVI